ncbi:hypothetical protein [Actinokineospora enzanensis]|uniref:hypothetical protein n=1 Tax=Actinokineospora enzanensis TaxID=155975 RepID=UPI0003760D00|nr:hypothetical protein [Actinokineospora enzanensis]
MGVETDPISGRRTARLRRSRGRVAALRADTRDWFDDRAGRVELALFGPQLDQVETVLSRMTDALDARAEVLAAIEEDGPLYEECRLLDEQISLVRRTFDWYVDKYDQRLAERTAPTLRAADRIVLSCWTAPFARLGRRAPTGPLSYLDARFDAFATVRESVPADLRAPADAVVAEFVRELPVPVVALPDTAVLEPWWLVLAAHETGHHVQRDLDPGLRRATSDAVMAAGGAVGGWWYGWAVESFADAFAVFTVGAAGAWAVDELTHGRPRALVTEPDGAGRYPPAAVRTALLGELAALAGVPDPGPGAAEIGAWVVGIPAAEIGESAREAVLAHLRVVPDVAAALAGLTVAGHTLPQLCGWTPEAFSAGGKVEQWARQLPTDAPNPTGIEAGAAARWGVAGGVAAAARAEAGDLDRIRVNLTEQLALCGPDGHLAGGDEADVDPIAERLTDRLLAHRPVIT